MRFFTDRHGDQYPTARIKKILLNRTKRSPGSVSLPCQTVVMEDDERLEVESWEVDRVVNAPTTVIPAQPGTYLLGGVDADDANVDDVWQTPIIAWSLGTESVPTPHTPDGADDGLSQSGTILFPNGMVVSPGNQCFRAIEDWFQEERAAAVRAAEAKAAASEKEKSE